MHELAGSARTYVARVEGRVPGGFSEPLPNERRGEAETLALHEALMEHPDALGPVVSGCASSSGCVLEATLAVEASCFGEAANRAVAAYRAAVLHAGLGSATSVSEGSAVVRVEVCTEEEFDWQASSGEERK